MYVCVVLAVRVCVHRGEGLSGKDLRISGFLELEKTGGVNLP